MTETIRKTDGTPIPIRCRDDIERAIKEAYPNIWTRDDVRKAPTKVLACEQPMTMENLIEEEDYEWVYLGPNGPIFKSREKMLTPIFEYRDWSNMRPDEDGWNFSHRYEPKDTECRVICPAPECLRVSIQPGAEGPIATTGHGNGRCNYVTAIAIPCEDHAHTFSFKEGWHKSMIDALVARDGPPEPVKCPECARPYTSVLWGRCGHRCPQCTYEEEIRERVDELEEWTMIEGKRHGLDRKAAEYRHLPPQERKHALEQLKTFIWKANEAREWRELDPNGFFDLEPEYDRRMAETGRPGDEPAHLPGTVRYIIEVNPHDIPKISRMLNGAGVRFDPRGDLCALPGDRYDSEVSTFMGRDVDYLSGMANRHLAEQGAGTRFKNLYNEEDPEAQYDFLMLMTKHTRWTEENPRHIVEIDPRALKWFAREHSGAIMEAEKK